jgi:uncharacterized membrane protein YbjE (DUF340 family)
MTTGSIKINRSNDTNEGVVMITRTNWPAVVGLCFTLSAGWYSLAVMPLKQDIEKHGNYIEEMRKEVVAMQVVQGMNTVTLQAFKESIDRLNATLIKLEERIK